MKKQILDLIKKTATIVPADLLESLLESKINEKNNYKATLSLDVILNNIYLAQNQSKPICQDTGVLNFFVKLPPWQSTEVVTKNINSAVIKATEQGFLRPNAVDPLSNKNSNNNLGEGFPKIYFEKAVDNNLSISLILKGGGSENVSTQISLPFQLDDSKIAARNLAGVEKTVLQIINNIKGKGCAPGIISVHIGGDRESGYFYAKKNFLKKIGEENKIPKLAKLEKNIINKANKLNIGPMGIGGKTTILDCKISSSARLPASFFVTVSYMCWALRRHTIILDKKYNSFYPENKNKVFNFSQNFSKVKKLHFKISEAEIRKLKIGDIVLVNGIIYLGRDAVHSYSMKNNLNEDLSGSAIYHCGPIAVQKNKKWKFISAGPTTSMREEPYQYDFIKKNKIRAIIGKGGMGPKTLQGLKEFGAVYLQAIGGAGVYYAQSIKKVLDVKFLEEFGSPEALWKVEVSDFLCIVTMDSQKNILNN